MPELPEIEAYLAALRPRIQGQPLEAARLASPFLLRTVEPPLASLPGRRVETLRRLGKRIVLGFEGELFAVLHLMIAGRLHWKPHGTKVPGKIGLAAFDFPSGTLTLTEAGSEKRAALHLVAGEAALAAHDPGGLEVLDADLDAFRAILTAENHTLKRALTDPRILSGVGNAFSDEILHRARLSPFQLTRNLTPGETATLFRACRETLTEWTERLRAEVGDGFPEKVTAFHAGMAVHGRFGQPCPVCGTPVQRLVYADSEANYCPGCQTGGRLLADRALSRLLKQAWPKPWKSSMPASAAADGRGSPRSGRETPALPGIDPAPVRSEEHTPSEGGGEDGGSASQRLRGPHPRRAGRRGGVSP